MLPAVVKLCCGISYPHLRSLAGLQRTAVAVIGQELTHLQRWGQVQHHTHAASRHYEPKSEDIKPAPLQEDQLFFVQQGQEAMRKALCMLEDRQGWKVEIEESNGDVICSKLMPGAGKVFRLEAVLEASVDELYDLLFVRVEEMHQWNPSIHHIKIVSGNSTVSVSPTADVSWYTSRLEEQAGVPAWQLNKILKRVGPETIITHEVSTQTAGNMIGQRDFLSVRHSCKQKSSVYLGGAAIQLESFPPQAGYVRAEDGPTCIVIQPLDEDSGKSRVTWLLNMDVKGWLPKSIVNQALPRAQLDFTKHLRRRLTASTTLS